MESKPDTGYECFSGQIWIKTEDDSQLLFKFYDPTTKEESDPKKIKDEQIFPKASQIQKIKKFQSLKQKIAKEMFKLEADTPVYVMSHNQYGVIRKILKQSSGQHGVTYEARLSNTLENVIVDPSELKRQITIDIRLHSLRLSESQIYSIHMRIDTTVAQVLSYIAVLQQIPTNFINLFHKGKKLNNQNMLYKEGILDGDKILSIEGQGDLKTFNRFNKVANGGWGFSKNNWDAIIWRPNRTIMVAGFGTYGIYNQPTQKFFLKYKFVVQNIPSEEKTVEVNNDTMHPGTKVYPIMLDGEMIEVLGGTDFIIQVCGSGTGETYNVRCCYGQGGNSYKSFDNPDKDLFEIVHTNLSTIGTGIDSGQIPTLYYYLVG